MKLNILSASLFALSTIALVPSATAAPLQTKIDFPQASPAATVTQRFGLTDVSIEYSRPSVKGRKIFGELVPFGAVWRTGANAATKITFSTDVKFGEQNVPAGEYALVTIPNASEWTVILNKSTQDWGTYAYDEKNDVTRVKVKPVTLSEPVETFTIGLNNITGNSAVLALAWDKTLVPVKLTVDVAGVIVPQIQAAMKGEGKKPYFQAAMFYYENDLDLKQAIAWMDEAVKEQPDAVWVVYRRGLLLAKAGDKQGALAAANKAKELAAKAGGELGGEYTRLSESLIAKLK